MPQTASSVLEKFRLDGRVAIITGGGGFLGRRHAEAIMEAGGVPVLWDVNSERVSDAARQLQEVYHQRAVGMQLDVTDRLAVRGAVTSTLSEFGQIDILVNNAANDPKVEDQGTVSWSRFEHFPLQVWHEDLAVGLTGAFLCSQIVGETMAKKRRGVILNIASDLSVIAPDQRIYQRDGLQPAEQPVKPVTYSVVKHGLIGLTKYLATYWAEAGIRVNALSPGGVHRDQPEEFRQRLTSLIPLGRMADRDEYQAALLFLVSDASSYMTGANVIVDGGRTCW